MAEKSKSANGEGFSALMATLTAELRTFAGITPEMALPVGAARQAAAAEDRLPLDADPGSDFDLGRNDDAARDGLEAGRTPTENNRCARSDRTDVADDRDFQPTDTAATAAADGRQNPGSDDGVSEITTNVTRSGKNNDGGQQALAALRTGATATLPGGRTAVPQTVAEEFKNLAAGRQVEPQAQSGAYKPGGSDGNPLRAVFVDQGSGMASQPTASLAASASINAQLARGMKPQAPGLNETGLSLEDGIGIRGNDLSATGPVKTLTPAALKAAEQAAGGGELGGRTNAGQPSPATTMTPAAPVPLTVTSNAATTLGGSAQAGQPVSGQMADPALANSQPTSQSQAPARARNTAFAGHMRPTTQQLPTAEQVAIQIQRAIGAGTDRITVQLRPQELGRVEVKMEVGHDGKLLAVISADKPETLDLLQRDQRSLQ